MTEKGRAVWELMGWGRYPRIRGTITRPERVRDVAEDISRADTFIPRGAGRAYGDAALNGDSVIDCTRLNRFLAFDEDTGVVRCEAGVTLEEIIATFLPRGWFLPVTPGTKFPTIAGSVACDVHGKNHHRGGCISNFVSRLEVLLPSGEVMIASPSENESLFAATVGGMGLTGVILSVDLALRRVTSSYIRVDYERTNDLDEALSLFEDDDKYEYSVAWIDCLARGRSLGRSVLMRGDHLDGAEIPQPLRQSPLRVGQGARLSVPLDVPQAFVTPLSLRAFNAAYYYKHPRKATRVVHYDPFFYPLDGIRNWNRGFGAQGFVQYQCVLPMGSAAATLTSLLERLSREGRASSLAVLKRFGAVGSRGILSFPSPGLTLALDIPVRGGLFPFLKELDRLVLAAGGRLYLAKDSRMDAEVFREMYPAFPRWRTIRDQLDPSNRLSSALARRLQLVTT